MSLREVRLEEKEDKDATWEGSLFWCSSSHLPLFTATESSIGFSFTFSFTRHWKKIKKSMREEIMTVYPLLWRTVHSITGEKKSLIYTTLLPSSLPAVNTCGGKAYCSFWDLFIYLCIYEQEVHWLHDKLDKAEIISLVLDSVFL